MSNQAREETRRWLEQWVIGLELCPFARHPYEQGLVDIVVSSAGDEQQIYRDVLEQLERLSQLPARELETTLVVVERGLRDFLTYLEFLDVLDHVIVEAGLEGVIQIAGFHPQYRFAGEPADDPANFTNRSPYPMFHLIREASLEKAVAAYGDAAGIPDRNIRLLRDMGLKEILARQSVIMAGAQ